MNPMGAGGGRGGKGEADGGDKGNEVPTPEFVVMVPNVTCLYPRKGNCQELVAGPNRAAPIQQGQRQGVHVLREEGNFQGE